MGIIYYFVDFFFRANLFLDAMTGNNLISEIYDSNVGKSSINEFASISIFCYLVGMHVFIFFRIIFVFFFFSGEKQTEHYKLVPYTEF